MMTGIPIENSLWTCLLYTSTSILARDLAWDWIGDAHERFSVGDEVLVRILSVRRNSLEAVSYTHLDVYKRQDFYRSSLQSR